MAMVSDFFYPKLGGVEAHILNLSKELKKIGYNVIVITKSVKTSKGIKYVEGIKTYYLDLFSAFGGSVFPTFLCAAVPLTRIFLNEQVSIVHAHQCSTLAIEAALYGKILGLSVIFTNHSLVSTNTLGGVVTGTAMQIGLLDADKVICVSQASRNNTAERLRMNRKEIEVIPNAVAEGFTPKITEKSEKSEKTKSDSNEIVIAIVSRLTQRKGASLLAEVLMPICSLDSRIKIVIAGDGDKKEVLEQAVELHGLHERVIFLGSIHPQEVKEVLKHSNMFLNTSLTDAFCISIIEAASCGLYTVSTNVDGIAEILPQDMITLTPTTPEGIIKGVRSALDKIPRYKKNISHMRIRQLYRWSYTAEKVSFMYKSVLKEKRKVILSVEQLKTSFSEVYSRRENFCVSFLVLIFLSYLLIFREVKKYADSIKCSRIHEYSPRV